MSQKTTVLNILKKQGFIDNFYAINNKITIRLGAVIYLLKQDGWNIKADAHRRTDKNCHYYLVE